MTAEPYLSQAHGALGRLLALFDADPVRPTRGLGDRLRWAWRLADYASGIPQGAAHGLARLVAARALPEGLSETRILARVENMIDATRRLARRDGSLEESFPLEGSFCVTALVAFDLLSAADALEGLRERVVETVRPMVRFLCREDETHGVISNHLATASAALYRWHALTGEGVEARGRLFLDRVLAHQSREGWLREYESADPGYQSLCTCFLADLHRLRPDLGLAEPLARSLRFLQHFAHPDGSFGGIYGSRNTRLFWPAGVELLAPEIPEAAALARAMRASVHENRTVTLAVVDDSNLVPLFNACVRAALDGARELPDAPVLPCERPGGFAEDFPAAGLHVRGGERYYTVISTAKGGALVHFDKTDGKSRIDGGTVAEDRRGRLYSTQAVQTAPEREVSPECITVTAPLAVVCQRLPTPLEFAILRLLSCTFLRLGGFRRWLKRRLARMLLTGGRRLAVRVRRHLTWTNGALEVRDEVLEDAGALRRVEHGRAFTAVTMASAGYWQRQDDA